MKRCIGLLIVLVCVGNAFAQLPYAQHYRLQLANDTLPVVKEKWSDPKKATVLAMAIPGAGQIYNKRYWKAGIVYAGGVGLYMMFRFNSDSMQRYQDILTAKIDGDSSTVDLYPDLSLEAAINARNIYRRYRDISILGFFGLYALQIIDANVDAHLKEFRVNEDLSLKVRPRLLHSSRFGELQPGLTLQLRLH